MAEDKNKTLERVENLIKTLDEQVTKDDFLSAFQSVIDHVAKLDAKFTKALERLTTAFNDVSKTLKESSDISLSDVRKEVKTILAKALKEQETGMNFIKDKVSKLKNGDDGISPVLQDIVEEVLTQLPEQKDILLDSPKQFRDKVIPIIEELIKEILKDIKGLKTRFVGGGIVGRDIIKEHDLSSSLNGTLKTFALPAFWRILEVTSSSFPITFRKTVDYTTNELTMEITFTSEVDASTMLASGQSITILYVSA